MPYLNNTISLVLFTLISLNLQSQDVILYEHIVVLKNTKKLSLGELYIYIPKKDSFQIFNYFEFSTNPDTIIIDRNKNRIAKWKSTSINGIDKIHIKAIGSLSYSPSTLQNLGQEYFLYRLKQSWISSNSEYKKIGSQNWISLKEPGSHSIRITQKDISSTNIDIRNKFDLFKTCDKCGSTVRFISQQKNRFKSTSYFNIGYNWYYLYSDGTEAYTNQDLDKALLLFNASISLAPNYYPNFTFRGMTYARLGKFEKALQSLQQAMRKINTDNSNEKQAIDKSYVLYAFANLYALQNNKEKAVNFLKKAIELDKTLKFEIVSKDEDLINLVDYAPFQKILEELKVSQH